MYHFTAENIAEPLVLSEREQIPGTICQYMKSFQLRAVRFLHAHYKKHEACIYNDESGLGKCATAAVFLSAIGKERKCLIVVQNDEDIVAGWQFHLSVLSNLSVSVITGNEDCTTSAHNIYIAKWCTLKDIGDLSKLKFDYIVIDNRAQMLSNSFCVAMLLKNYEKKINLLISSIDVTSDLKLLHNVLRLCGHLEHQYLSWKIFQEKFSLPNAKDVYSKRVDLEDYFLKREILTNYCKDFRLRQYRHQFSDILPLVDTTRYKNNLATWRSEQSSKNDVSPVSSESVQEIISSSAEKNTEELFEQYIKIKKEKCLNEEVAKIMAKKSGNAAEECIDITEDPVVMSPLLFVSDSESEAGADCIEKNIEVINVDDKEPLTIKETLEETNDNIVPNEVDNKNNEKICHIVKNASNRGCESTKSDKPEFNNVKKVTEALITASKILNEVQSPVKALRNRKNNVQIAKDNGKIKKTKIQKDNQKEIPKTTDNSTKNIIINIQKKEEKDHRSPTKQHQTRYSKIAEITKTPTKSDKTLRTKTRPTETGLEHSSRKKINQPNTDSENNNSTPSGSIKNYTKDSAEMSPESLQTKETEVSPSGITTKSKCSFKVLENTPTSTRPTRLQKLHSISQQTAAERGEPQKITIKNSIAVSTRSTRSLKVKTNSEQKCIGRKKLTTASRDVSITQLETIANKVPMLNKEHVHNVTPKSTIRIIDNSQKTPKSQKTNNKSKLSSSNKKATVSLQGESNLPKTPRTPITNPSRDKKASKTPNSEPYGIHTKTTRSMQRMTRSVKVKNKYMSISFAVENVRPRKNFRTNKKEKKNFAKWHDESGHTENTEKQALESNKFSIDNSKTVYKLINNNEKNANKIKSSSQMSVLPMSDYEEIQCGQKLTPSSNTSSDQNLQIFKKSHNFLVPPTPPLFRSSELPSISIVMDSELAVVPSSQKASADIIVLSSSQEEGSVSSSQSSNMQSRRTRVLKRKKQFVKPAINTSSDKKATPATFSQFLAEQNQRNATKSPDLFSNYSDIGITCSQNHNNKTTFEGFKIFGSEVKQFQQQYAASSATASASTPRERSCLEILEKMFDPPKQQHQRKQKNPTKSNGKKTQNKKNIQILPAHPMEVITKFSQQEKRPTPVDEDLIFEITNNCTFGSMIRVNGNGEVSPVQQQTLKPTQSNKITNYLIGSTLSPTAPVVTAVDEEALLPRTPKKKSQMAVTAQTTACTTNTLAAIVKKSPKNKLSSNQATKLTKWFSKKQQQQTEDRTEQADEKNSTRKSPLKRRRLDLSFV